MLRTRIAAVAAAALLFTATNAITAATAQTAANQPTGKPLQLLKITEQPSKTTKSHTKAVAKSAVGRSSKVAARPKKHAHVAALRRHRPQLPVKTAAATPTPSPVPTPPPAPDAIWPTANPAMTTEITASTPAAQPAAAASDPSEVVVAGQTVKVASPDEVNEIDLDANHTAPPTSDTAPVSVATSTVTTSTPPNETSEPAPKSDAVKAFAARTQAPNEVGSTSWILQVLAALGGAVTAGTVAWFLIGGTPQRTYG
jgi:hypothetical protein